MKNIRLGHIALLIVLVITFSIHIHFDDYQSGIGQGLGFIFMCLAFIVCFMIVTAQEIYQARKSNERNSYISLWILVIFIAGNAFLVTANQNHYWKSIRYEGETREGGTILLYENNTFEIICSHACFSSIYFGDYHQKDSLILIDDERVLSKTGNHFTKRYIIKEGDSVLQPIDSGYSKIRLSKTR